MEHAYSYLFSATELAVLLAGLGARNIEGFDLEAEHVDPAATAYALHGLLEKRILTMEREEGAYKLDEPVKAALLCCIRAKCILRVLPGDGRTPCCVYVSQGDATAVIPLETMINGYRLLYLKATQIRRFLEQQEYLPGDAQASAPPPEEPQTPLTLELVCIGAADDGRSKFLHVIAFPQGHCVVSDATGETMPYHPRLINAWLAQNNGGEP